MAPQSHALRAQYFLPNCPIRQVDTFGLQEIDPDHRAQAHVEKGDVSPLRPPSRPEVSCRASALSALCIARHATKNFCLETGTFPAGRAVSSHSERVVSGFSLVSSILWQVWNVSGLMDCCGSSFDA